MVLKTQPTHETEDHQQDTGDHRHGARGASRRRLKLVLAITGSYLVIEAVGALLSNSLALLADAGHMLSDVGAVALALFALTYAERPATPERTFGYARAEILAALLNALTLILVVAYVLWHAWERIWAPPEVQSGTMLLVATVGLGVNLAGAWILMGGRGHSLNEEGAFLHVLGDALGSVGAIVAGLVMLTTGFYLADPIVSVLISLIILWSAWGLLQRTVAILMESTPPGIDLATVRAHMLDVRGVKAVHDLHVWTLTSGFVAMSAHVISEDGQRQQTLSDLRDCLMDDFGISHTTLQIESESETAREEACEVDPRCLPVEEAFSADKPRVMPRGRGHRSDGGQ